jgi:diguanylate cyclase (GGDEF)-like protein/PAS domain S-box-containing protein
VGLFAKLRIADSSYIEPPAQSKCDAYTMSKSSSLEKLTPPVEEAISLAETDFRILAEDAPVMLWLTNAQGKVIFTNGKWKKFIAGKSVNSSLGDDVWIKALHPDDIDFCLKVFSEAFFSHQGFSMEYRLRRADGEYRHILDTGEPYISKEGQFAGFIGSSTDITDRKNHETQLRLSQLEMSQHNQKMQYINELNSYLQVCLNLKETYSIIEHYAKKIFAGYSGALYLFDENRTMVEVVAHWGNCEGLSLEAISPDECWGLRQGKVHIVEGTSDAIVCHHIHPEKSQGYVCAPIVAQGEMIGVLSVTLSADNATEIENLHSSVEGRTRLIAMTADNLAMALVSLKLREALRARSVRDPLTSLFNRRYLEETLARELSGCKRSTLALSVIMIDVDHFKKYNDTHGHDAGDFVLTQLAELINSKLRSSDVACRYGGEEFILVMPGASKKIAMQRAEELRSAFENQKLVYQSRDLNSVTASLGVATFSTDGVTAESLIKGADEAMYRAKSAGRNCVMAA